MEKLRLHLEILPKEQRILWDELGSTPDHFTLYGGTALALQLGHRESIDFDFFSNEKFDTEEMYGYIPYIKGTKVLQEDENTLTCSVEREGRSIQVSFFGDLGLAKLKEPIIADNNIKIASAEDVLTTKLKTVIDRSSVKDYIDIATGLENGHSLKKLLSNTKKLYGKNFNTMLSLKALSYFKDVPELDDKSKKIITKSVNNYYKQCDKGHER